MRVCMYVCMYVCVCMCLYVLRVCMFISHMQVQANGEAARLAQMMEHLGGMAWLDMKATNLTVEGMKYGVLRSKVFILLLTADVPSSLFE